MLKFVGGVLPSVTFRLDENDLVNIPRIAAGDELPATEAHRLGFTRSQGS
ncbi:hypothetical protein [Actinoalloteichus caeruleus]|nr:hypothetical protein [Actinoalloteichus caeruleus]